MSEAGDIGRGTGTARRWPRWMGIALVVSLALNLLVMGALATAAWRHRHWDARIGQPNVYSFTRSLPRDRRREIMGMVATERQQLLPFRAEVRRARSELARTIATMPFDADRYQRANEALIGAEARARAAAHKFFGTIVLRLNDRERAQLAKWLEQSGRRTWHGRRGRGSPHGSGPPPTPRDAQDGTGASPPASGVEPARQ